MSYFLDLAARMEKANGSPAELLAEGAEALRRCYEMKQIVEHELRRVSAGRDLLIAELSRAATGRCWWRLTPELRRLRGLIAAGRLH